MITFRVRQYPISSKSCPEGLLLHLQGLCRKYTFILACACPVSSSFLICAAKELVVCAGCLMARGGSHCSHLCTLRSPQEARMTAGSPGIPGTHACLSPSAVFRETMFRHSRSNLQGIASKCIDRLTIVNCGCSPLSQHTAYCHKGSMTCPAGKMEQKVRSSSLLA